MRSGAFLPIRLMPLFLALLLIMGGCGSKNQSAAEKEYSTSLYSPKYATGFEIFGAPGKASSILKVTRPWQGDKPEERLLFIQRAGERVPEGFRGQILSGDAERIICMSSTQIAMLHLVDASKNVVGVSGMEFITAPEIQSRRAEIGDVGYDGNINYELIAALKPDIVLLYGISGPDAMESKLKELGIPFIYVGEYVEESPLGKSEWMMALAEIVGKRNLAEEVFAQIPEKYNALRKRLETSDAPRPKVMLNLPYGDSWFMPPMGSYFVTLLEDAGADYIYSANTSRQSKPIDLEEAFTLTSKADKWLNLGNTINSVSDLREALPKFANLPVVQRAELYNNTERTTPSGGNDFYESGVVNPDLVLRDLIKIMHPSLVSEPFTYYRRLPERQPDPLPDADMAMPDSIAD